MSYVSPENEQQSWEDATDLRINATALVKWVIAKTGADYAAPTELHCTFEHVAGYFKLKNHRTRFRYYYADSGGTTGLPGFIKKVEDPYGNQVTYQHDMVNGRIQTVTTEQGWTVVYTYVNDGLWGKISRIDVHAGTTQDPIVQQVEYTYHTGWPDHHPSCGSSGDLILVEVTNRTTAGSLTNKRITMYRYYSLGDTLGGPHQLKAVYSPASVAQAMDELDKTPEELLNCTDAQLQKHADSRYEYYTGPHYSDEDLQGEFHAVDATHITRPVKKQYILKGEVGAIGTHTFYYMDNGLAGFNSVYRITVEDFLYEDSSGADVTTRRVYGTNNDGQLLREVFIPKASDPGDKYWCTSYWRGTQTAAEGHNNRNKVLEHRGPRAHRVISSAQDPVDEVQDFLDATTQAQLNGFTADDGLIRLYDYNDKGLLAYEKLKKKGDANPTFVRVIEYGDGQTVPEHLPVKTWDYHTASIAQDTAQSHGNSLLTQFAYTFHDDGKEQVKTRTVTREAISAAENGSGEAVVTKRYYDANGRLRWAKDGEGYVHYYSYHPDTGGLALEFKDVNTAALPGDVTGTGWGRWVAWTENEGQVPDGFTRDAGLPTALDLETKTEFDSQGRQRRVTDPEGMATATAYCAPFSTRVYPGWTGMAPTLPVKRTMTDAGGRVLYEHQISPTLTAGTSGGLPTGVDTGWSDVSRTYYAYWDDATAGGVKNNGLLKWVDTYHDVSCRGTGELGTNFHRTVNRYEGRGLKTHVIEVAGGTSPEADGNGIEQVTVTHYDERKRPYKVERGVSLANHNLGADYDAAEGEGFALRVVSRTYYDGGTRHEDPQKPDDMASRLAVGNDLKTTEFAFYDAGHNDNEAYAVKTCFHYDWRDRLRGIEPEAAPYTVQDVDFRGSVVAEAHYQGNLTWSTVIGDEGYAATDPGPLNCRRGSLTKTHYDQAGRACRTETYAVNPSDGSLGDKLVTDTYYDRKDRLVAEFSPGGGAAEHAFDGAGREFQVRTVTQLAGADQGESYYSGGAYHYRDPQPKPSLSNLSGGDDKIVQIAHTVYDKAGNVTEAVTLEANHDDDDGLDATTHDDFVQTAVYSWYDNVHRLTTKAVFGTGQTQAPYWQYNSLTRPANEPAASGDTTGLVTKQDYDSRTGRLDEVTDPKGVVTMYFYDNLGRKLFVAENHDDFSCRTGIRNTGGTDTSEDRVTAFTYDGLGNVLTQTALDPNANGNTDDQQTTTYTFADPYNATLVTRVEYPDGDATNDNVATAYHLDGQVDTRTFQKHAGQTNRTVITFAYDATFRRLVKQRVTTVGDETYNVADRAVQSIQTDYDTLGRQSTVTSYTSDDCTGDPLNQVEYAYNALGALEKAYQEHEGTKDGDSLHVRYAYDETDDDANNVFDHAMRLESIRYPSVGEDQHTRTQGDIDARLLYHLYTDAGGSGISDALSRTSALASASTRGQDDVNVYAAYRYNGTGRLVIEDYTGPEVCLDYADDYDGQHTAGTYEGFDRYGRVTGHLWRDYDGNATLDRYAYTYDYNSNRTWRENNGPAASGKDEKYTYDGLNRLTKTERGDRNGDAVDSKNREEDFTLDQVGNWKTYLAKQDSGGGLATEADHDRAVNDANEVTGLTQRTGAWDEPAYSARGNMTGVPQPDDPANSYTCAYDAWNRLVEVKDGARVHARYEYDGLNRRVKAHVDSDSSGGPDTWVHFYYTNDWQLLETRETTASENTAPETLQPHRQYVWSVRYTDALVRRDTNDDADDLCDDETLYALGDANFNTTAVVDGTSGSGTFGDVVERYVYDPYGNLTIYLPDWSDIRAASSYDWTVLFAGYWRDAETGLYHVRHRMYHVRLGLWLTRDPEGYVDGMSLYAYVAINPIGRCDPSGRLSWDDAEYAYRQVKNGVPNAFAHPADAVKGYYMGLGASVSSVGRHAASMGVELTGLGLDTVSAAQALSDGGRPTGKSIIPRLDPGTMEFADGGNRAAGLATGIATDPLGVGKAVVGGMAQTIGGTLIGDPEAGGALALDCGVSLLTVVGGKALGLFDDAARSADDVARYTDDVARFADDFADDAAGAVKTGGRLGNQTTRAHVADVAGELESRGWRVTGGGGRFPEEYLRGPGGGRLGSNFVDITAVKRARILRINTVDTLSDSVTPTAREAAAAAAIRSKALPREHLLLVPKPK